MSCNLHEPSIYLEPPQHPTAASICCLIEPRRPRDRWSVTWNRRNPLVSKGYAHLRRGGAPFGSPNGVRTRVSTLRGWCPRPLDDGTLLSAVGPPPELGGKDSNPQWLDQNQLCCQLHHPRRWTTNLSPPIGCPLKECLWSGATHSTAFRNRRSGLLRRRRSP